MCLGTSSEVHRGEHTVSAGSGIAAQHTGSCSWRLARQLRALLRFSWLTRSGRRLRQAEQLLDDKSRLCRELRSYLLLDLSPEQMPQREFARVLCRAVATRSCFARAALLLAGQAGALSVVGSAGVDDVTVNALDRWGAEVGTEASGGRFLLHLERRTPSREENGIRTMSCANMHALPLRSAKDLLGVLVVSAEPRPSVRGSLTPERLGSLLEPLETLCARLSVQVARQAEMAGPEPRRREHTGHRHAEGAAQRRIARRRGGDRRTLPGSAAASRQTADQVASMAVAARAGRAELLTAAEGEAGASLPFLPISRRSLPQLLPSPVLPGPQVA